MTTKKDLKKRIRERQQQTKERYTTARAHVLNQASVPAEKIERFTDISTLARQHNILCATYVTSSVWRREPIPDKREGLFSAALLHLSALLQVTQNEPAYNKLRAALLYQQPALPVAPPRKPLEARQLEGFDSLRSFLQQLKLGMRGPSRDGQFVSLDVQHEGQTTTLVASLLPFCLSFQQGPILLLALAQDFFAAEALFYELKALPSSLFQ